jgi:hypothetical protein
MTKLQLASGQDEKPAKLVVALPTALPGDLVAYANYLNSRYFSVAFSEGGGAWPV